MADLEGKKKEIQELREKIRAAEARPDRPKDDPLLRRLRKALKRAQRAVRKLVPLSREERAQRTDRLVKLIEVRLGKLTKTAKKPTGDPHVHSLRKRLKSLTRQSKRLARLQKKGQATAAS